MFSPNGELTTDTVDSLELKKIVTVRHSFIVIVTVTVVEHQSGMENRDKISVDIVTKKLR